MASIFKTSFDKQGHNYEFSIDLDYNLERDRIALDEIVFEIKVTRTNLENNERKAISASATITEDEYEGLSLKIEVDGEIFNFNLEEEYAVESIIEKIPAVICGGGDPTIGCLVRSGLSTIVRQILDCKTATQIPESKVRYIQRIRRMANCLFQNVPSMTLRLAHRITKCMVKNFIDID